MSMMSSILQPLTIKNNSFIIKLITLLKKNNQMSYTSNKLKNWTPIKTKIAHQPQHTNTLLEKVLQKKQENLQIPQHSKLLVS
jgi:hypothetical protein